MKAHSRLSYEEYSQDDQGTRTRWDVTNVGGIASAMIGLVASAWLARVAFGRWMPRVTDRTLSKEILSHGRADKWLHAASALLLAALNQLVGGPERKKKHRLCVIATAMAILLVVMSAAGVLSKTFLGFEESPWAGYDKTIQQLRKVNEPKENRTPEEKRIESAISARLTAASAPHWKYMYAAAAIVITLAIYLMAFFRSVKAVRRLISEIDGAQTWVQKAGIACFATVALLFGTLALVLVFACFSSPIPVLTISLAHLVSAGWIVVGALAVAVFEFWVGDPWFKALVLASVLPGAAFVMAALLPLASDLATEVFAGARKRALEVAHQQLGPAFIPLCMTVGMIVCVVWLLMAVL